MSFPTKKNMKQQISDDKMAAFLRDSKDEKTKDNKGINDGNGNVDVDVNVNVNGKFEDLYSRQTCYIQNDLIKKIEKSAKKMGKGGKTKIINDALTMYFATIS